MNDHPIKNESGVALLQADYDARLEQERVVFRRALEPAMQRVVSEMERWAREYVARSKDGSP